ncbi:MAG TPA: SIR2 family protein [Thermoanaerobaculia bacterium]|nr:SIR2 family protein [Thermoanaerobaculia bacterium]
MDDSTALAAIAEKVAAGQCILFLGAGVHAPPPNGSPYSYPDAERPPMGGALSTSLADQTGFKIRYPNDSARNLQRVAFDYELQEGRNRRELIEEIDRQVDAGKKPSPVVRALAELNFPLVITTNYDQLFEKALYRAEKSPLISYYSKDPFDETEDYPNLRLDKPDKPFLFKIHGDIKHPESVVVTDEDYIDFVLRMSDKDPYHPVPETFRFYFKRWPTLFLGYSLMDYNLRLLFKTLRWRVDRSNFPGTFSVDPYPDLLLVKVYSHQYSYVTFIAQDVWTFVPDLFKRITGREMPQ